MFSIVSAFDTLLHEKTMLFCVCACFQVNIVDPLKLTQEFSTILANKIIATNVEATMILHKEL